jgi:hypothetical protein
MGICAPVPTQHQQCRLRSESAMNPWTHIALPDYEGHMALPAIGQAAMLAEEFQRAVAESQPRTVTLLGCAGGNGLEALCDLNLERIVCVDINRDYLAILQQRYQSRLANLECHACELEVFRSPAPVDLVFGGLVFEYARLDEAVVSVARLLADGGHFYALLQLPAAGLATVSPSPYAEVLASVGTFFRYVDGDTFINVALKHALQLVGRHLVHLPSGKSFAVLRFRRGSNHENQSGLNGG